MSSGKENAPKVAEIWVEKYRPKTFEDIEGDPVVLNRLKSMIETGTLQHIMISGPPGTGKTTSILAMARHLYNGDSRVMSHCILHLNASDERGVDVVRHKIKEFAKKSVAGVLPAGRHKIIILDEVDSMTSAAQQALRRIMEIYSDTTRFALICNQSTKIIEPIQSRCTIVRFGRLSEAAILKRVMKVCLLENVAYNDEGLQSIVFTSEGDLRIAMNNLQSTVQGFGMVSKENVMKVCDIPPPERIKNMLASALNGDWRASRTIAELLIDEGYNVGDLLSVSKGYVKRNGMGRKGDLGLDPDQGLQVLDILTKASVYYADGNTSFLQLDACLAEVARIGDTRTR